jgi:hypothetical protein
MQLRHGCVGWGITGVALMAAFAFVPATTARAGDPPVVVRPAIRITVSPGSTPTAKFVQYGYYSGGWGWGGSYRGWGGLGWGGYGGWGAYGGNQLYYSGLGNYVPVYGTYYGGYPNYGYPVYGGGYANYAYPGYGYPGYGLWGYGYPAYGYAAYGAGSCGCGYGGGYGLGYRIW